MKKAGQILPRAVGRDEVLRTARAQLVMRDWQAIVGVSLATRSHPDRFEKGVVWVAVQGSAWAQELRMRKEIILGRLRERSGDSSLFTDVRFGVRPLPALEAVEDSVLEASPMERQTDLTIKEIAERRLAKMRGRQMN